jgi:hypothetical protein
VKNKNIITVINLIRLLPLEQLRNPEIVINLIRSFGLVQWGPPVFGDDEAFRNRAVDMAGIYQIPAQLAGALIYLSRFEINSYAEVGVFQGGNFLFVSEYLRRFNPGIKCTGIDPTNYLNPEIAAIISGQEWMNFRPATSEALTGVRFDLVFIDGDHESGWVVRDWNNLGRHAKICMFHDVQETTCPEIIAFWGKLKKTEGKQVVEFLDHTSRIPLQGIGIIHD